MRETPCFRINTPAVVHETIEGEVVIISFDTGTYYSLGGVGARVWQGIEVGAPTAAIVARIAREFDRAGDGVASDVAGLIEKLRSENLIVAADGPAPDAGAAEAAPAPEKVSTAGAAYSPPVLHAYSDMQALLLLDPIHEVDETGWPRVRTDGET